MHGLPCGLFLWSGEGEKFICFATTLNMPPSSASSPGRRTSGTTLLALRSFLSIAFLASLLSRSSQCVCVCVCVVDTVCRILESSWDLVVLCDCQQQQQGACKFTCHQSTCSALAYTLVRGEEGQGTIFVQPSALTPTWQLKLATTPYYALQSTPNLPSRNHLGCLE